MYRIEIVSNKSVEDDIVECLEEYIPGILYTILPLAYGRGGETRKLGTTTWPETNFVLFGYVQDDQLATVREVMRAVKQKFTNEGIKLFAVQAEEV